MSQEIQQFNIYDYIESDQSEVTENNNDLRRNVSSDTEEREIYDELTDSCNNHVAKFSTVFNDMYNELRAVVSQLINIKDGYISEECKLLDDLEHMRNQEKALKACLAKLSREINK